MSSSSLRAPARTVRRRRGSAGAGCRVRRPTTRRAPVRSVPRSRGAHRPGQQLCDDLLVHLGVLPKVQPGQVKPTCRPPRAAGPAGRRPAARAATVTQRGVDHVEIGEQFVQSSIRLQTKVDQCWGWRSRISRAGGAEPAVHHPQRPAGLVGAGGLVARPTSTQELRAGRARPAAPTSTAPRSSQGQLVEVAWPARRARRCRWPTGSTSPGDVRVAVAVSPIHIPGGIGCSSRFASGPATPAARCAPLPFTGITSNSAADSSAAPLRLVLNLQPRQPDWGGLPQGEDLAPQLGVDGSRRRSRPDRAAIRINWAMRCWVNRRRFGAVSVGVVITGDTSAPRRRRPPASGAQVGGSQLEVRRRQGAVGLRFHRRRRAPRGALPVDVLGDVGQQREMAERGSPDARWMSIPLTEQLGQLGPVDLERRTGLDPGALHQFEHLLSPFCSRTVSPRIAPSSRMSSRIGSVASRRSAAANRADRFQRHLGDLSHLPSIGGYRTARRTDEFRSSPQSPIHPQPAFPRMHNRIYVRYRGRMRPHRLLTAGRYAASSGATRCGRRRP